MRVGGGHQGGSGDEGGPPSWVSALSTIVGASHVLTAPDDVGRYAVDWMRQYRGRPRAVVRPASVEEVAGVLTWASTSRPPVPIVVQGGNTGLVGGSVPMADEVVLSTDRMTRVLGLDPVSGVVEAEAGCVLQTLQDAVAAHRWTLPLDLGSKGSCCIGGNVATNAGGLRFLRYGSLHGSVLGLEVVTGDGRVLDMRNRLRKDNVGYDLKQVFIGSEGTLGVITKVVLQAAPAPACINMALFQCATFAHCLQLLQLARDTCGEILTAVEFVDAATMELTTRHFESGGQGGAPRNPFHPHPSPGSGGGPFYMFLETGGSVKEHDDAKLATLAERAYDGGVCMDGVVPPSTTAAAALWRLREEASVAISARGHVFKYDLSFPTAIMYDIVDSTRHRLEVELGYRQAHDVRVVGYGHVGDGNIHLNVSTPSRAAPYLADLGKALEPWVYDVTLQAGGSISAEHGLGQAKSPYLPRARPPAVLDAMHALKRVFDPAGILNPGKVLPPP